MFYFWRGATAALVLGFLCQSGRHRPENVSILSSLISKKKTIEALHTTTFPQGFSAKKKKNNIPLPTTSFATQGDAILYRQNKQTTGLHTKSPAQKKIMFLYLFLK